MPWTVHLTFKAIDLKMKKLHNDTKGRVYSLEMAINPSLQLDFSRDISSVDGAENTRYS